MGWGCNINKKGGGGGGVSRALSSGVWEFLKSLLIFPDLDPPLVNTYNVRIGNKNFPGELQFWS